MISLVVIQNINTILCDHKTDGMKKEQLLFSRHQINSIYEKLSPVKMAFSCKMAA